MAHDERCEEHGKDIAVLKTEMKAVKKMTEESKKLLGTIPVIEERGRNTNKLLWAILVVIISSAIAIITGGFAG